MANQRGMLNIEVEKNDRKYIFSMEIGSQLGECYDAAYEVLMEITEMAKKATEQAKSQEASKDQ